MKNTKREQSQLSIERILVQLELNCIAHGIGRIMTQISITRRSHFVSKQQKQQSPLTQSSECCSGTSPDQAHPGCFASKSKQKYEINSYKKKV